MKPRQVVIAPIIKELLKDPVFAQPFADEGNKLAGGLQALSAVRARTDLQAAYDLLNKTPSSLKPQPGDYAEYEDEANPVTVVLKRKDGTPVMTMPVEVWDQIRAAKVAVYERG
jgi:hypothetical protein